MKLAITGGTGFIGGAFRAAADQYGAQVRNIPRGTAPAEMAGMLQEFQPDAVVHLAACSVQVHKADDVEPLLRSNIEFGTQVLEAMVQAGVSVFVNCGSYWQELGTSRTGFNLYSASKNAFEQILRFYVGANNLQAISLRLYESISENDPRPKLFTQLISSVKAFSGQPIEFNLTSGEQKTFFLHISDVVSGLYTAAKTAAALPAGGYEVFELRSGEAVSVKEAVEYFSMLHPGCLRLLWGQLPGNARQMIPEMKYPPLPHWHPTFDWKASIEKLSATAD